MRYLFPILILILSCSCGSKKQTSEDILLRYGESSLTIQDVVNMIPKGISSADSTALFDKIVEGWIRDMVLSDFAVQRLYDTESIERKVKAYRNSLIVQEYILRMSESRTPKIEEQKIKEYYDAHRKEMKLEVPLIKGIFLKINKSDNNKDEIKEMLMSEDPEMIDRLEEKWLERALEYNYFLDKWVDWETLSGMIPYRFGDPMDFLKDHKYFETDFGDCTYYLFITDWIPAGEEQPYEFARLWISDTLTQGALADYERVLVKSLVEKYIKEKKLEVVSYDPLLRDLKDNKTELR